MWSFRFASIYFLTFAAFFKLENAVAQESPHTFKVPPLRTAVTDLAAMLAPTEEDLLEGALRSFREQGGAQIAVLTLPNLEGLTIEQASIQIVDAWKLGSAEKDDGILLLIAKEERKIRIEVGQGLEGHLPDASAKRIIDVTMTPLFKSGNFGQGIIMGALAIAQKTNPEIDLQALVEGNLPRMNQRRSAPRPSSIINLIFFVLLFGFLIFTRVGRMALLFSLFSGGRSHGGGYGGSGGGFGGSFGGGGGGFSGGGASGGW